MENENTTPEVIESISDFDTMLAGIDTSAPVAETEDNQEADTTETVVEQQPQDAGQNSETEPEQNISQLPQNKQNNAFANMRVTNRKQLTALQMFLQKTGYDPELASDPDKVIELLDEYEANEQAEEYNVPPELVQRLNYLERMNRQRESEQVYQQTVVGLRDLQSKFNLTQQELQQFAMQLQRDGINPFIESVDIQREFIARNLDWIIQRAKQAAVQEALSRQDKAAKFSSTPAKKQGKPAAETTGDKINTMAQFDRFLHDL